MPIYKNDTGKQQHFESLGGNIDIADPGATFETYRFYSTAGLTRVSTTPLKNRNAAITIITLGGEAAHSLNVATRKVLVLDITGTCTVKPQVTTAVPILLNHNEESVIIPIDLNNYPCDTLLISGSGTCTVLELKW